MLNCGRYKNAIKLNNIVLIRIKMVVTMWQGGILLRNTGFVHIHTNMKGINIVNKWDSVAWDSVF